MPPLAYSTLAKDLPRYLSVVFGLFALGLAIAVSHASADAERKHEPGFFMRINAGVLAYRTPIQAYQTTVFDPGDPSSAYLSESYGAHIEGVGLDRSLQLGATIFDNFAIYWEFLSYFTTLSESYDPDRARDPKKPNYFLMKAAGLGACYFFADDYYLSATLIDVSPGDSEGIDHGGRVRLTFGKEWSIAPDWAIGAGLSASASLARSGIHDWSPRAGFVVSLTYN